MLQTKRSEKRLCPSCESENGDIEVLSNVDKSYIPRAHVQFLEQAGIRVVPISYLDPIETIEAQLNEVNGLYCPGDSSKLLDDIIYRETFEFI